MGKNDTEPSYDVFKFRRFRLNLIRFLRLPLGIKESALREVLRGRSQHLLASYEARAEMATSEVAAPEPASVKSKGHEFIAEFDAPEFDATAVLPLRAGSIA